MSPIGISIFILILCPKIENNISINIRTAAIIPTMEMIFGISLDRYNV